jgi:hypothetical protein
MELFQRAIAEIGDVSAAELSDHLEKKHGVKIEPAFIPLFKASLQDLERTNKCTFTANPLDPMPPSQASRACAKRLSFLPNSLADFQGHNQEFPPQFTNLRGGQACTGYSRISP